MVNSVGRYSLLLYGLYQEEGANNQGSNTIRHASFEGDKCLCGSWRCEDEGKARKTKPKISNKISNTPHLLSQQRHGHSGQRQIAEYQVGCRNSRC